MLVMLKKKKKRAGGIKMREMIMCFLLLTPSATRLAGALAVMLHCQKAALHVPI